MASYDVMFIGGGPAGYVGAIRCAQLGLSVAVVEREGLGGTCVLWGCIPAKALLESASMANKVRHAAEFGVNVNGEVSFDYGVAMKRSRTVSAQNSKGVEFLFKKNKITWLKGTGRLVKATGGVAAAVALTNRPVPLIQVILFFLKRNSTPLEFWADTVRERFMATP